MGSGLGVVALNIGIFALIGPALRLGSFADSDPWRELGNLFSNFYEELIYRGLLLLLLRVALSSRVAAVCSASRTTTRQCCRRGWR